MMDKLPEPDKPDEGEAERRFNETLGRLVNTPPKPHKDEVPKGNRKRKT
jgi:hypothetical protein